MWGQTSNTFTEEVGSAMRMNVTNLRAFFAVAECGSFSAAAVRLGVSQPALSRQVGDLEASYKVKLLDRQGRNVRLTEQGEILWPMLASVFSELGVVERTLKDMSKKREMMTFSVRSPKLMTFLTSGCAAIPSLSMSVEMMPSAGVYRGLIEARCDFGLLTLPEANPNLDVIELGDYPIIAIVGPSHRLAARRTLSLTDLESETIIIGSQETSTRRHFDRAASLYGIRLQQMRVTDNFETCVFMARAGLGVGIIGGDGDIEIADPDARLFVEPEMRQPLHFACLHNQHRLRITEILFDVAQKVLPNQPASDLKGI